MSETKRLVYAEDVKDLAIKLRRTVKLDKYTGDWPCLLLTDINDVPTADAVEVVHAEWQDGYGGWENKKSYISIDCSNCEEYFKIPGGEEDAEEWKKRFVYCPFCGAKMDGDENENSNI